MKAPLAKNFSVNNTTFARPYPIAEIPNSFHVISVSNEVFTRDIKLAISIISVVMSRLMPAQDTNGNKEESGKKAETHFATLVFWPEAQVKVTRNDYSKYAETKKERTIQ